MNISSDVVANNSFEDLLKECSELAEDYASSRTNCTQIVEVIVTSFGTPEITLQCIRSLLKAKSAVRLRILVSDDCSGDSRIARMGKLRGILVIESPFNQGYLRNCNKAVGRLSGEFFVLLNNDVVVKDYWIDRLLSTMLGSQNIAAVGAKLINPDGTLQEAGGIVWSDGSAWNWGSGQSAESYEFNYVRVVDYCSAACLLIRRVSWDLVNGFTDEYAPAYCEDSDLAFKFRALGYQTIYQPACEVIHKGGVSHGNNLSSGVKSFQQINQLKLATRWRPKLVSEHYYPATNLPLAIDRAGPRPWVVFIEQSVPTPEKDAGSQTIDQILKVILSLGYRLTLWPVDVCSAGSEVKRYQQMGIEVVSGARERGLIQLRAWLSSRVGFIDAIFVSRPSTFKLLQGITRSLPKIPVLFYGHDLHWVREKMAFESRFLPRTLKLSNAFWKGTFLSESTVWESADLSVYPSKSEVHLVRSWLKYANRGVSKVDNVEYGQPFWLDCSPKEYSFSDREGAIFVAGWQHPPNVEAALWFVNQVLPLVTKMINGFTITFAGSNMPEEIKRLRSSNVILVADLTKGELNARYERARVVVVPLLSGAGIKLKVLEACAHGVPIVTTAVGIQGLPLTDNNPRRHDVRLPWIEANLPSDFASHLAALMSNEPRALELSGAGPQYIRNYFSQDSFRSSWAKLFSHVVTRGLAE